MSVPEASPPTQAAVVVTDANVVINFIHAGMLADLPAMVNMTFILTDEVYEEIIRPEQRQILDATLAANKWTRESMIDPDAIALFATLAAVMGRGACSCERRGDAWGEGRIVDTPGLLLLAIRRGTLTVADADRAKALLETRSFKMKFRSFAELLR